MLDGHFSGKDFAENSTMVKLLQSFSLKRVYCLSLCYALASLENWPFVSYQLRMPVYLFVYGNSFVRTPKTGERSRYWVDLAFSLEQFHLFAAQLDSAVT